MTICEPQPASAMIFNVNYIKPSQSCHLRKIQSTKIFINLPFIKLRRNKCCEPTIFLLAAASLIYFIAATAFGIQIQLIVGKNSAVGFQSFSEVNFFKNL
jgi:penicillin-binding protein-related factor A (putative recombinase)